MEGPAIHHLTPRLTPILTPIPIFLTTRSDMDSIIRGRPISDSMEDMVSDSEAGFVEGGSAGKKT